MSQQHTTTPEYTGPSARTMWCIGLIILWIVLVGLREIHFYSESNRCATRWSENGHQFSTHRGPVFGHSACLVRVGDTWVPEERAFFGNQPITITR